jgi:hypothetical protein
VYHLRHLPFTFSDAGVDRSGNRTDGASFIESISRNKLFDFDTTDIEVFRQNLKTLVERLSEIWGAAKPRASFQGRRGEQSTAKAGVSFLGVCGADDEELRLDMSSQPTAGLLACAVRATVNAEAVVIPTAGLFASAVPTNVNHEAVAFPADEGDPKFEIRLRNNKDFQSGLQLSSIEGWIREQTKLGKREGSVTYPHPNAGFKLTDMPKHNYNHYQFYNDVELIKRFGSPLPEALTFKNLTNGESGVAIKDCFKMSDGMKLLANASKQSESQFGAVALHLQDVNECVTTAYYPHHDKAGSTVLFYQVAGWSFTFIGVKDQEDKQAFFDMEGEGWTAYSNWKHTQDARVTKQIFQFERLVLTAVLKGRVKIYLISQGQSLDFDASVLVHASIIPAQVQRRCLLLFHDLLIIRGDDGIDYRPIVEKGSPESPPLNISVGTQCMSSHIPWNKRQTCPANVVSPSPRKKKRES